jgi:hypothetical protein
MYDTTKTCAGSPWPDTSVLTHREYESGFLLPQLMGALASESGGFDVRHGSQRSTNGALFSRLRASLKQALKVRQPA